MKDDTTAEGIPLRDYFAGQYMASAFERAMKITGDELDRLLPGMQPVTSDQVAAALAYRYADAMIKRRNAR